MKFLRRQTAAALLFLLFSVFLSACGPAEASGDILTVSVLRIGKADAVLLTVGGSQPGTVLIDAGESDDAAEIIGAVRAAGTDTLDCLILTHFDKDHIGGAPGVLSALRTERILLPSCPGEGAAYDALTDTLSREEFRDSVTVLTENTAFSIGTAAFSVSVPKAAVYEKNQDNNFSLAVTVTHAGHTLFFAGDAERLRQEELMAEGLPSRTELLKVPHHGVWNRGLDDFFAACMPEYAVITCSEKNPPEEKTLAALEALGVRVLLTSAGNVTAVSTPDGFTVSGG